MRLVAGIHYIPFWRKFTDRDIENIIIKYLNAGANSIRVFLYQDGRDELMNWYNKRGEKYDLHSFSDEYFNRVKLLGELAKKYNFILKIDVLDNCSFFRNQKYVHPFYFNIQGIKALPQDVYSLTPKIKPFIKQLFKKHWEVLSSYKKWVKIGIMNEATAKNGTAFNYIKYKPVAEFHKEMGEILTELGIPRKYWRINPQTDPIDYKKQVAGAKGENAWTYSMGMLGAEEGKCKNVEGEIHGVGLQSMEGILPELFLETVFNPAFREISFSDDGVNDGEGENEGDGKWACETADEFGQIFEKVLLKALQKRKPLTSVEHLTRSPEKYINNIKGDMTKKELDKFITEETLIYYKVASSIHKKYTGEDLRNNYPFIKKPKPPKPPECTDGQEKYKKCPDGAIITTHICVNGKWQKTNNKCQNKEDCIMIKKIKEIWNWLFGKDSLYQKRPQLLFWIMFVIWLITMIIAVW